MNGESAPSLWKDEKQAGTKQKQGKEAGPTGAFYFRISLATLSYSHAISAWELAP
jgi:hypothetical protein